VRGTGTANERRVSKPAGNGNATYPDDSLHQQPDAGTSPTVSSTERPVIASESQFSLLKQRRFAPFFLTQFLGAFNDNVYKNALIILIAFQATDRGLGDSNTLINMSAGLFILPFFLFSATAGQLADKYEKSRYIRRIKLLEIVIMTIAAVAFHLGSISMLIGVLFLMGTQSTLFGPVKYGILPQHLGMEELIGGNGMVEMGTFLAILLGTLAGGVLIGVPGNGEVMVSVTVVALACLGWFSSLGIPIAVAVAPDLRVNWNPFTETWRNISFARSNRTVFLSILGISWFWMLGASYLAQLPNFTKLTLGGNEQVVTLLLTLFSLGIGAGSLLCERLSGRRVELGLVPFGSIGLTVFGLDLFLAIPNGPVTGVVLDAATFVRTSGHGRVLFDILLLGLFGGFYIVPLYALVQQRSEPSHRSRVIAANNILNALFMVASAVMAILLLKAGLSIPQLFLVIAVMNAVVALYIFWLVPEFLMRFLVWLLIHTIYRIRKEGLDHIPETGPVMLVCNHVSFVDALVIAGCIRRPVRFVIDHRIYKVPVLNFIFRTAGAIPIAPAREDAEMLARAYDRISRFLDEGEVVCIFPEGGLTPDGELRTFRPGIVKIIRRNPVPVVPMALRGLWGSFFSRKGGAAMKGKLPRPLFYKIALALGPPVPPAAVSAAGLQERVAALRGDWK
jgi:1-acyl-sn-glycerol-3-phosphate acyltransferase